MYTPHEIFPKTLPLGVHTADEIHLIGFLTVKEPLKSSLSEVNKNSVEVTITDLDYEYVAALREAGLIQISIGGIGGFMTEATIVFVPNQNVNVKLLTKYFEDSQRHSETT